MKTLLNFVFAFSIVYSIQAQQSGVITYEESIKIDIDVPPEMKGMIPTEMKNMKALFFTEKESIYKNLPKEENVASEIHASQGGGQIQIRMEMPEEETYRNLKEDTFIEKKDLFGRAFRISGKDEKIKWKMTGEQKQIAGYMCMNATYMKDTTLVSAWFTLQIPIQNGPGNIGSLPGMVLELDMNEGQMVTRAILVDLRALKESEVIKAPTKGREISREKFQKLQKEKMAEMQEMGGGAQVIIHRN